MSNSTSNASVELTGERKLHATNVGRVLHRIRATQDLKYRKVKAGDLGGWVESLDNIQGNGWVADEAMVYDGAVVNGFGTVSGKAEVHGPNAVVSDFALVTGSAKVFNADMRGNAVAKGLASVHGDVRMSGFTEVSGCASIHAPVGKVLTVSDHARFTDLAIVHASGTISGTTVIQDQSMVERVNGVTMNDMFISGEQHITD